MRVEQRHDLGQAEAIRRVDGFLDELMARQAPGRITITNARKSWAGNRMDFSFNAGKGFFATNLAGNMVVTDDAVVVESHLPGIVKSFVGEDKIREVIGRELARVLRE
jgi:hypothetical protein